MKTLPAALAASLFAATTATAQDPTTDMLRLDCAVYAAWTKAPEALRPEVALAFSALTRGAAFGLAEPQVRAAVSAQCRENPLLTVGAAMDRAVKALRD
jgi:hypothetical protein